MGGPMSAGTPERNQQSENAGVRRFGGIIGFGVLLGVALGVLSAAPAAATDTRIRLAILPLVVHSTTDREYLRSGLADMLASRLGREQGVAVIRLNDADQATTDLATAQAAGSAAGADWVLYGSFTRFGEGASLDLRCVQVQGEDSGHPHSVFVQSGSLGDIIPRLDNLAKRVAHHVTSGRSALPSVSAGEGEPASDGMVATRDEIEALRARITALEDRVFESATPGSEQTASAEAP